MLIPTDVLKAHASKRGRELIYPLSSIPQIKRVADMQGSASRLSIHLAARVISLQIVDYDLDKIAATPDPMSKEAINRALGSLYVGAPRSLVDFAALFGIIDVLTKNDAGEILNIKCTNHFFSDAAQTNVEIEGYLNVREGDIPAKYFTGDEANEMHVVLFHLIY
jgi:hypothetical protein